MHARWTLMILVPLLGLVPIAAAPSLQTQRFHEYSFEVAHQGFQLFEWDFGIQYGCSPGELVGIVLRRATDAHHPNIWTFNVDNVLNGAPARPGCSDLEIMAGGSLTARIVGVATPSNREAHFVITTLLCGGSCAGYWMEAFRFDGRRVTSSLKRSLGLGGVKFTFPRLALYRNDGYKECPSHWTRFTYRWLEAAYALIDTTTYTSPICSFGPTTNWPPDP